MSVPATEPEGGLTSGEERQHLRRPGRSLCVCASDTAASAAACKWALENLYREGDTVHLTYVVRCLQPDMEVFHGLPGTSYSFRQPSKQNREQELIDAAKQRLEARFLPLLRPHRIPYQLHLYAERTDCSDERVRELIVQDIEQRDASLVVLAAHNKVPSSWKQAEDQAGLGSVADYVSRNCRRPKAFVRPHAQAP